MSRSKHDPASIHGNSDAQPGEGERQHVTLLLAQQQTLTKRLESLHDSILGRVPGVTRIACALYDAQTDMLKTFINSTRSGEAIARYEYALAASHSLSELAANRDMRVIDDIPASIAAGNDHSDWLLEQGYRSSFTVPMHSGDEFLGFMFFDADEPGVFDVEAQRTLLLYVNLIVMSIVTELTAIRALLATAKAARDYVSLRDFETGLHLDRMARYARLTARGIAEKRRLDDEFIEHVYLFAPLHDIGKIGVPDRILLKPGSLDAEERAEMELHIIKGVDIVRNVLGEYELQTLPDAEIMMNIVAHHHEFLDGSGYPNRLQGDAIPIEARIVTVADIFDALTSARPYKEAWTPEASLTELESMATAGKLDVDCVHVVGDQLDAFSHIAETLRDDVPRP